MLHFENFCAGEDRAQFVQMRYACFGAQNLALGLGVGIPHADAHQEAIQLRFGQGVSSVMFDRILGSNYEERLRQFVGVSVNRDLAFVHGLQQRRLRLRRSAIDFVRQQHVGEYRATLEFKFLLGGGIDGNANNIGGQHVAGELHALKSAVDGASQRLSESGFANARNAFNKQVSTSKDAHNGEADDIVFAANHAAQSFFQFGSFLGYGNGGFGRHPSDSTRRRRVGWSYGSHRISF